MAPRRHPMFVVRLPNSEGCGHQHSHRAEAWNCAENIGRKRPNLSFMEVVKITKKGDNLRETIVGRATKYYVCAECKGMVFLMDDGEERGHYEDCKVPTAVTGGTHRAA